MNSFDGEFLRKPFTLAKIGESIEAAFARHAHMAESARQNRELRALFALLSPREWEVAEWVGKGLANPVGTFWSCVMLLEHIGEPEAAAVLMAAIEEVTADTSLHTRDLGGTATTEQVTQAVCSAVSVAMSEHVPA